MPEAVCTYFGGNHQMRPQGFAFLANEQMKRIHWELTPGLYKCKCNERIICEGSPEAGGVIGKYVTEGGIVGVGTVQGVSVTIVKESMIRETTSKTLPGYTFLHSN